MSCLAVDKKVDKIIPPELKDYIIPFRDEVCLYGYVIDEKIGTDLDWYALSIGWFLARGATYEEAEAAAMYCRYDAEYFN